MKLTKQNLENKLSEIYQALENLGDLQALISTAKVQETEITPLIATLSAQKEYINSLPTKTSELDNLSKKNSAQEKVLDELIDKLQDPELKSDIEAIPTKKSELELLITSVSDLKKELEDTKSDIHSLKTDADTIHDLSRAQLGIISNEKLSNSFDKVTNDLKDANAKWFKWLVGTSLTLMVIFLSMVIWQTWNHNTVFEIGFFVKIAIASPIILLEFFVSREYSRSQKLIEEYVFKAAIARSLEAYKKIIEDLFSDKEGDDYKKKLDFILDSIKQLYSSPMKNIDRNKQDNKKNVPIKDPSEI